MAKCALDSDRLQPSGRIEEAGESHHCVQLQKRNSDGRIVKIYFAVQQLLEQIVRQRIDVHFQAHRERGTGAHARTHSAQAGAFDRLLKLERVAPEALVAERVESEDLASLAHELRRKGSGGVVRVVASSLALQ